MSLKGVAADSQLDSYVGVSALAFLIWDTLINFSDEVTYIWQQRNSCMKYVYVFIRYFPILALGSFIPILIGDSSHLNFSEAQCKKWMISVASVTISIIWVVEAVLILRVYALFNRNKLLLLCIFILYVTEVGLIITGVAFSLPKFKFTQGCVVTSAPPLFALCWIPALVFETILFVLTVIECFQSVWRELGKGSIIYVIIRDGTWAYAVIFVIMLANTLLYQLIKTPLAGLLFHWALSGMSMVGSHLIVNLRSLASRNSDLNTISLVSIREDIFYSRGLRSERHSSCEHLSYELQGTT